MKLPRVLLQSIFARLPGEGEGGICAIRSVCKDWRTAVEEAGDSLWQEILLRQFGPSVAFWSVIEQRRGALHSGGLIWKQRYIERIIAGRNWQSAVCRHWHLPDDESVDAGGALPGVAMLDGAGAGSNVCALTVENNLLVLGMFPGDVEVWDLETTQKVCAMRGHTGYIHSIDVDMYSRFVLTASEDRTVRIWSLPSGECLAILEHPEPVAEVWWIGEDNRVEKALSLNGGLQLLSLPLLPENWEDQHRQQHPGGKLMIPPVITAMRLDDEDEDAEFLLWDARSHHLATSGPTRGSIIKRFEHAYMFDQKTGVLAVAGPGKSIRLHHVLTRRDLADLPLNLGGKVKDVFFGHSQRNSWQVIVGSDSREVVVFSVEHQQVVSAFSYTPVEEMTMFSLNEHLFCLTVAQQRPQAPDSSVRTAGFRVWDACRGERLGGLMELEVVGTPCDSLEFDMQQPGTSNVTVVVAGADGRVVLWTLPSGNRAELPCKMSMGEHGYLVAESNWRWLAVRDHSGVHVFDFLL